LRAIRPPRRREEAILDCRADGYRIAVAEKAKDGVPPRFLPVSFPVCLAMMGSERNGVSPSVVASADAITSIPMHGMSHSPNISTAAAVILNHQTLV
jgi:tRNA G18 (ribose-2'-O)-methylase SpoU